VTESSEDFAAMFEASIKAKRFERGQTLEGTIVAIGPEVAFVDVGGKGEATIEVEELKDEDGDIEVVVGDRIQAMVVSTAGGLQLSRKLARGAATDRQLEDAFRTGLPVEGKVETEVKGGYEVRIGRQRGFCPFSQIDTLRAEPSAHIGKVYAFRIVEYKEGGRNLVVSRRALLDEEQRATAAEVRRSIVAGAVVTGRVASVREFGAFVDLGGGVQGLLHVSEMGWSRVLDPAAVLKAGDEITVKVLRVEPSERDKQKISLGLKQLVADPWARVQETYAVGQVHTGRVTRVADFGAFVELEPGVEALAHVRLDERLEAVRHRVQQQWRVDVTLDMPASFERMSGELNEQIYLIVQEAVLNAARHASATTIQVILESNDDRVSVQVLDDGKGFPFVGSYDLAALNSLESAPLTLRERVTELGGDLHILSGASGAHLRITLPLAHASFS
jgi:small subunit ribosomal protein S1